MWPPPELWSPSSELQSPSDPAGSRAPRTQDCALLESMGCVHHLCIPALGTVARMQELLNTTKHVSEAARVSVGLLSEGELLFRKMHLGLERGGLYAKSGNGQSQRTTVFSLSRCTE